MNDQDLYIGASENYNRSQKGCKESWAEFLETIKIKNSFFEEALTDLINESYEYGE